MPSQSLTPDGGLGRSSAASWDSEDEVKFVDTDGDTNVFRLSEGERINLEVNGEMCLQDLLTCRLEGRTLFLQSAGSKKTTVTTIPKGQEEVVLRVMALLAKRSESTSMVEFLDAEGRTAVLRLSDAGLLELHIDSKKCLSDIFSCRLDGPDRRVLHLKDGGPFDGKATLTVPEGQEEVIERILALVQKRGMIQGEVEFVDTDGDTNLFRLTEGGCLELYVNGQLREVDLSDITLDMMDGRTLHCKAASSKWATLTTVPPGQNEVALCILALFHKRGEASKEGRFSVAALPVRSTTHDGCLAKGQSPFANTTFSTLSTDVPSGHSQHAAESKDSPCLQRVENLEVTSQFGMGFTVSDLPRANSDLNHRTHWMLSSVGERHSGGSASPSGVSSGRNSTGTTENSHRRSLRRRYWMLT
mmetsp:Transcript_17197/g.33560  ORF Transcript_17197/g.33560 Transcript_17197/m.33560 type:complete len:416 (-) Transcript_17197:213-1460(-)